MNFDDAKIKQRRWLIGLAIGALLASVAFLVQRTAMPQLTAEEWKRVQRLGVDPRDYAFVQDVYKAPLSYPAGKQEYNNLSLQEKEWDRFFALAESDSQIRVSVFNILCQMEKSPKREQALRVARHVLAKDNEIDQFNGLRLLDRFNAADCEEQMRLHANSKYEAVRMVVKRHSEKEGIK